MKFENFKQHVVGKGAKEVGEEITKGIEKYWEKGRERHEGELEKTPEELEVIATINEYLKQEFEEMGIKDTPSINPEQIHILPPEIFKKYSKNGSGVYSPMYNSTICKREENRLQLYKTMLHECVHMVSAQKYHADIKKKDISEYRTGYGLKNVMDQHEHFRGLNEAITENITKDILHKNKDNLIKKFNIPEEESNNTNLSYTDYRAILNVIIKKVAKYKGEDEAIVWKRIKKGQFTGEMMHLRDIEKTFGKGSLRVLASLGSGTKDLPEEEINEKILRYFTIEDIAERDSIAHKVLVERERFRYIQRKK